ncbi:MAG: Rpn family recombination-promoting nuclease/putative transposase [Lachnospiraceae bacterium]|nr:Rpn family recombination-promoting nuclease/putative transposase [Lachnospiraceae bacterium]
MSGNNKTRKTPVKKPFEELTITDNYMFQAVMRDPNHVKPLLEMIIGKEIREIVIVETEKTQETGYESRGIRMDVYIKDDENTVYDVEMQSSRKRYLGKRFRYYQSAIDVDVVNKGSAFNALKTSYIIFITTYDPYEKGWYMYPFETLCKWDPEIRMKDASTWIVLNTKGTKDKEGHEVSEDIKEMLSYMDGNEPKSDYSRMLDKAVREIKQSEERRLEYMSIYANAADERDIGEYRGYVRMVRDNNGLLSDDVLVKFMKITDTLLSIIRRVLGDHPDWDNEAVAEEVMIQEEEAEAEEE